MKEKTLQQQISNINFQVVIQAKSVFEKLAKILLEENMKRYKEQGMKSFLNAFSEKIILNYLKKQGHISGHAPR